MSTDDPEEAAAIAAELDRLNIERREIEARVTEDAARLIDSQANIDPDAPLILAAADDWHPGVIGIVAGRLRERYRRPALVIGIDRAANVGKGSGRSQPGVNLGLAVQKAFDAGLLLAGGGHAMAAGLSVRPDRIPDLREFLTETLRAEQTAAAADEAVEIDYLVSVKGATRALVEDFTRLAPFGQGNPEPMFALSGVRIAQPMAMKGGHVGMTLTDEAGVRLRAVAWRAQETPLGQMLLSGVSGVSVAGRLKPDDFRGPGGVQMEIEDAADPRQMTAR